MMGSDLLDNVWKDSRWPIRLHRRVHNSIPNDPDLSYISGRHVRCSTDILFRHRVCLRWISFEQVSPKERSYRIEQCLSLGWEDKREAPKRTRSCSWSNVRISSDMMTFVSYLYQISRCDTEQTHNAKDVRVDLERDFWFPRLIPEINSSMYSAHRSTLRNSDWEPLSASQ